MTTVTNGLFSIISGNIATVLSELTELSKGKPKFEIGGLTIDAQGNLYVIVKHRS